MVGFEAQIMMKNKTRSDHFMLVMVNNLYLFNLKFSSIYLLKRMKNTIILRKNRHKVVVLKIQLLKPFDVRIREHYWNVFFIFPL